MNFTKIIFFIWIVFASGTAFSQRYANQVPQIKRYTPSEVIDSDYGITIFNKMVPAIGGDS